jgi:arylsulfatase A-like enzyme
MKKIILFFLIICFFVFIFFFLKPTKKAGQYINFFKSVSFGKYQDQHEKHLKGDLEDIFNAQLGLVYEAICKKLGGHSGYLLNTASGVVKKHFSCANGVFQINNINTLMEVSELSFKFRITDPDNYYLLIISIKPFNKIRLIEVENGLHNELKNQNTLLWDSRNARNDIFIFYFNKYLLIMNEDRLIALYNCLENLSAGNISFSVVPEKKADKAEILHSTLDSGTVSCLEQELMFLRLIPDSSGYHWNAYYPGHLIPFNGKKHEFIQRVELGNITKPSILIPAGAEATWNLVDITASRLKVSLALVDKYIFNPERIIFKITIKSKRSPALIVTDKINWNSLINHHWKDLNIDLSDFTGEKINISFQTEILDLRLPTDDNIVSVWGSPKIVSQKTPNEKNVILFILDAVRPDHLSCYGYIRKTSPTIDALADSGVIFKSAITAAPWTLPSHMAIFSGFYPSECGYNTESYNNTIIPQGSFPKLRMEIHTMAEYLSDHGYSTAAFTGGGMLQPEYNFDQGFYSFAHLNSDKSITNHISSVIDWIKGNLHNKFFITFHTYETHCPYTHNYFNSDNTDSLQISAIDAYDSGILFADDQFKRVIDFLKSSGILDETLIIIISDHGENFSSSLLKKNDDIPCGSHGTTLYDAELKIPLIISGAGLHPVAKTINEQVRTVDILPTILDILNIETENTCRGRSLLPLIEGKTLPPIISYSEGIRATNKKICNKFSVRTNKYKLILNSISAATLNQPKYELYDLENDPNEKTNLKNQLPSVLNNLINIMASIRKDINVGKSGFVKTNKDDLQRLGYIDN